jgi:hypothetical protein
MNIFFWASSGSFQVPWNTTHMGTEVRRCGAALGKLPAGSHVRVSVPLDEAVSPGYLPMCVRFDDAKQEWTTEGVSLSSPTGQDELLITCLSSFGAGTYAVVEVPSASDLGAADRPSRAELSVPVALAIAGSVSLLAVLLVICQARRGRCLQGCARVGGVHDVEKSMTIDIEKQLSEMSHELSSQLSRSIGMHVDMQKQVSDFSLSRSICLSV